MLSRLRNGELFISQRRFQLYFYYHHGFANDTLSFPKDFLLGTDSSAFQVGGGWNEGGT